MLKSPLSEGSSEMIITLAAEVHVQRRANDTIAIYYGNLLYAIPVQYTQSSQPAQGYPNLLDNIRDYELRPAESWAYAIDPSSLRYNGFDGAQSSPLWNLGGPTSITERVCEIQWELKDGHAPNPPPKVTGHAKANRWKLASSVWKRKVRHGGTAGAGVRSVPGR